MQMPVGYLVDRFGSRLLLTIAVFICSMSSLIFASATIFNMAILSRILLGFCSATAFIGALKLITVWFEPKKLALLVGITQALGMIGASTAASLVPHLNASMGWRHLFYLYAIVFFILSILICLIVRSNPKDQKIEMAPRSSVSFSQICSKVMLNKFTWINALYAGCIYAPTDVMGELWGREFLKNIHGIDGNVASHAISLLFIGWAIGGPCAGWLADHFGRRPIMLISSIIGLILIPMIFYMPGITGFTLMVILFFYGLTNTGLIASYATAGELQDKSLAGVSMAIANMFSVLLGAFLMPFLGFLLEWQAQGHVQDGALVYTPLDYQRATFILPICLAVAVICAFFVKETLPRDKR
jgi:MFS family permease